MAQKRSSTRRRRTPAFPDRIFALASPRSIGGRSLFDPGVVAEASTVAAFASDDDVVARAVDLLAGAGFEVLQSTSLMINIAGPRELFEEAFATSLVAEERTVIKGGGEAAEATFFDTPETDVRGLVSTDGTRFEAVLEGVAIEEPTFPTATAMPPLGPLLPPRRPCRRGDGLQRAGGAPRRDDGHRHQRGDGRHGLGAPAVVHRSTATGSTRSCSGPARPTPAATRTATARASRRTCSRPRRTARSSRSRPRPRRARWST